MKIPRKPPILNESLFHELDPASLGSLLLVKPHPRYLHWDELRHRKPPSGVTHENWWAATKLQRLGSFKPIPLQDLGGRLFQYSIPDTIAEALHQIDLGSGGLVSLPGPITNPHTRDQYLVRSLMEEAITSSQLEGAATTREEAKAMIRAGRKPRDTSERMILNNYNTMRRIASLKDEPLTPQVVFEIHRLITEETLDDPGAAGRLRSDTEYRVVSDLEGEVFHQPPHADGLASRLAAMCAFANGETPGHFVHPAVRAILLHFWLAYDHPFVDGNGRTARALFYWAMLRSGFWIFEFISISSIIRKAPAQYGRAFLFTETDDNDLTYFLLHQTGVIGKALDALREYIDRKSDEAREMGDLIQSLDAFNHRQAALLHHALKHPGRAYTIEAHRASHDIAYQTARTDLLKLSELGLLDLTHQGKKMVFYSPGDLSGRLSQTGRKRRLGSVSTGRDNADR